MAEAEVQFTGECFGNHGDGGVVAYVGGVEGAAEADGPGADCEGVFVGAEDSGVLAGGIVGGFVSTSLGRVERRGRFSWGRCFCSACR